MIGLSNQFLGRILSEAPEIDYFHYRSIVSSEVRNVYYEELKEKLPEIIKECIGEPEAKFHNKLLDLLIRLKTELLIRKKTESKALCPVQDVEESRHTYLILFVDPGQR